MKEKQPALMQYVHYFKACNYSHANKLVQQDQFPSRISDKLPRNS